MTNDVIGEILPLALVVGLSPIPLTAVVVLLSSPRPVVSGAGFLLGWAVAIAGLVAAAAGLVEVGEEGTADDPSSWVALGKIALGGGVLLLAYQQWTKRPAPGTDPVAPSWMASIDSATPLRAIMLGAALATLNLKHLPLFLAGGFAIGASPLSFQDGAVAIAAYVVVASAPVAAPVLARLVAPRRATGALEALRAWLTRNNAMVMSLLFLIIGTSIIGSGLSDL